MCKHGETIIKDRETTRRRFRGPELDSKVVKSNPSFVEKHEGYFVNVRVENSYLKMLIDTGASVIILRNDIF